MNASHATVKATRELRECFVGFFGAAVECDLDGKRRIFAQIIGDLLVDQNAIGKERYDEALLLRKRVDFEEIFARKDFAAGKQNPDHAHVRKFSQKLFVFLFGKLAVSRSKIAHRKIVVAVLAFKRTAPGYLERGFNRDALVAEVPVQPETEFAVRNCAHGHAASPTALINPAELISLRKSATSRPICCGSAANSSSSVETMSATFRGVCTHCQIALAT